MIWFVGKVFGDFRKYFFDHNIPFGLLSDGKDVTNNAYPMHAVDFSSKDSIINSLQGFKKPISGVMATYETYVYPAAIIAEYFGLPGLSPQSALACTDKARMREHFLSYSHKISPQYTAVDSWSNLENFANTHKFPLIIKPANLVKSLLVTKNNSNEELRQNYTYAKQTIAHLYKKHKVNRSPSLIVEEFLDGSVHSVDAFVDAKGEPVVLEHVVDYETGYDIGKNDNYHFSRVIPSRVDKKSQQEISQVAAEGIIALKMKSTPAHVEVILTKRGPKIVEIGARVGGYRPRMHNFANGIDMYKAVIDTAMGKPVDVKSRRNYACAVIEIFPDNDGKYVGVANFEKLSSLKTLDYLSVKAKPGKLVGRSSSGYKASVVIMLGSNNYDELKKEYEYIKHEVDVIVA